MKEVIGHITTSHRDPSAVCEALAPDNLAGMETRVSDGVVITSLKSSRMRSVIASVDDYLMNLAIAEETCSFVSGSGQR
ncbi:MAG: KEOPS complex subunit Pcc1 [Methanomicrobiales archaeon]|nr:KEOPS complex subunit Pcc1 [Methanomicrobiales archaeon]